MSSAEPIGQSRPSRAARSIQRAKAQPTTANIVDAIGDMHDELSGDIATLKTDVATLKTEVAALKTDVAALKTDVATLKTDVATLKTDVATLKTDVATLKTDVATLKTEVAALKTDVATLKTDVAALKTDHDGGQGRRGKAAAPFRDNIRRKAVDRQQLPLPAGEDRYQPNSE